MNKRPLPPIPHNTLKSSSRRFPSSTQSHLYADISRPRQRLISGPPIMDLYSSLNHSHTQLSLLKSLCTLAAQQLKTVNLMNDLMFATQAKLSGQSQFYIAEKLLTSITHLIDTRDTMEHILRTIKTNIF